jgi:hypothetical protein
VGALLVAGALGGAVALVGACTETPPVEPPPAFTGRWELVGVGSAALPLTLEVALDGSRKRLIEGRLEVRTRGRLDDIKRIVWERPSGARVEDVTDTVTSPFTATAQALYLRRYALLAASDWVDTGTVADGELRLRARYLEQQFGPVRNLTLTYRKRP